MMTFVLAATMLVGALFIAAAFDGVTAEAPPCGVASHVLAAGLLAMDHSVPFGPCCCCRQTVTAKAGQQRAVTLCEAGLTTCSFASGCARRSQTPRRGAIRSLQAIKR